MEIRRDGTWFYEGTPIGRKPLVRLFSTILKREDDKFFLVTPVEKVGIRVEDAPFVAVDFEAAGAGVGAGHQLHHKCRRRGRGAGPENRIRVVRDAAGEPSPYVHVRAGLEALIDRKSFYRLVDLGEARRSMAPTGSASGPAARFLSHHRWRSWTSDGAKRVLRSPLTSPDTTLSGGGRRVHADRL
jgi:hypothetical protein